MNACFKSFVVYHLYLTTLSSPLHIPLLSSVGEVINNKEKGLNLPSTNANSEVSVSVYI